MPWNLADGVPGVRYNGLNMEVLGSSGNTSVGATKSGGVYVFDTAAGITFTLPTPVVGANYQFAVKTTVTSGNHKIITNAATTFMQGVLIVGGADSTTGLGLFAGDGTTHVAVTMNGTTSGGILGSVVSVRCISSTLWEVYGDIIATTPQVTPFATT